MKNSFMNKFKNIAHDRMTDAMLEVQKTKEYKQAEREDQLAIEETAYYLQGIKDGIEFAMWQSGNRN